MAACLFTHKLTHNRDTARALIRVGPDDDLGPPMATYVGVAENRVLVRDRVG